MQRTLLISLVLVALGASVGGAAASAAGGNSIKLTFPKKVLTGTTFKYTVSGNADSVHAVAFIHFILRSTCPATRTKPGGDLKTSLGLFSAQGPVTVKSKGHFSVTYPSQVATGTSYDCYYLIAGGTATTPGKMLGHAFVKIVGGGQGDPVELTLS